jgi:cytochrome c oxidase subunit 2
VYKSKHLLPIVIIGLVVGALTAAQALLIDWLPPATSEQAERSFTLLWVLFWSSAVFFVIVTAVIIYSIWKFRAADDDLSEGPPIHGNTTLEVVWTAVPSIVLVAIAVYGYIVLDRNEAVAAGNLKVDVYAQQFAWTYGYPVALGLMLTASTGVVLYFRRKGWLRGDDIR